MIQCVAKCSCFPFIPCCCGGDFTCRLSLFLHSKKNALSKSKSQDFNPGKLMIICILQDKFKQKTGSFSIIFLRKTDDLELKLLIVKLCLSARFCEELL